MSNFMPKTYFLKTYGCQTNVSDSEKLANRLDSLGFVACRNPQDADLLIINSCSVRQKSEDKVYGLARQIPFWEATKRADFGATPNSLPEGRKKPFIVLTGCMVGSVAGKRKRYEFKELKDRTPWVDLYISSEEILSLPDLLFKAGFCSYSKENQNPSVKTTDAKPLIPISPSGYVNISYGCDNFCSYCVVPYARGPEISRSKNEIFAEIEKLLELGVFHITLCGQNVNSWGLSPEEKQKIRIGSEQKLPFANLLREICAMEKVKKITFISSNPFDFTQDLVEAIKSEKIDNYLHIAVQSGNNDILAKMNRKHTIEEYLDLIGKLKSVKPSLELGTDIIVGFPGETESQFLDTVNLFQKVKFNVAFISIYSPRKGTVADKIYPDDIPLKEKKRRHGYLTEVWKKTLQK